ncbi:MAG TPA: response regulator [Bryobacteraceae bacterium]|nr:response regulator [Bryobacteraceae bacterium]
MGNIRPSRILIIEDNAIDREVYKRCLGEAARGFEFAEAECGAAGIEMARSWCPDCALVDVNLPDMDGIEVLAQLKRPRGQVPFAAVVLTAYSEESVAVRAMQAGAMDYLPKASVGILPHVVTDAIARFLMQQHIEEQRAALEASARRYRELLEAMPQMVWTARPDGSIEYGNRRWLEYTGSRPGEMTRLDWDRLVHPEDRARTWQAWNQTSASQAGFEIKHRLRRASDGEHRWHLVRAVPIRGPDGEVRNWFGTCTEIEGQRRAEEADLEQQKLESLGRLAGGLAHDLNNLLVVILGGTSYAMDRLPAAHPAQEKLQDAQHAGGRAAELLRKLLAFAGKGNLNRTRANVEQAVWDAIERADIPASLRLECQAGRRVALVETDAEMLRQVIADLLRNAVEAIGEQPAGAITVRTAAVELSPEGSGRDAMPKQLAPGHYVAIEVRDTGCGMDEETQKRIFDPFFSTKFLGRGLSLAAAQGFLRSNGGAIEVNSAPGKGARFCLFLPAADKGRRAGG